MAHIQQLPPGVVNKIAAGEVIERPASVVKELLENSVDADASRVEVTVVQGGSQLIRVADDGCGITADELTLAVASHATSKITDADDLFRVATLGFRGEALASIAEISQLILRSRTVDADAGFQLDVNGGQADEPVPCGCPVGTTIEVRNLFFNTPVRRKFLRTTQTEMGHSSEAFTRIALAYPAIHFQLRHNERTVFDLPPVQSWRDRIARLFGDELAESMIWIESTEGDVRLSGYVVHPSHSRANNRMQYLLLNGRYIRDRSLQHALGEAYRGLLMTGRCPIAFLQLELPPAVVDVNVHPSKLEVRFQDGGNLYSQLLGTIRRRFLTSDLTAGRETSSLGSPDVDRSDPSDRPGAESPVQHAVASAGLPRQERFALNPQLDSWETDGHHSPGPTGPAATGDRAVERLVCDVTADRPCDGLQVHNRYIVTETEDGVIVIDQHALHERILYEQLRTKVLSGQVETQALLVPEPVNLAPPEAAAVLESRDLLAEMGILVQSFGGDTVLVSAYPAMLANINPAELLRQVVEQLLDGGQGPDRRALLDDLLHMVSCKAAIKAGDRLTPQEITALVEQRELVQDAHHCPHGRPTALVFTRQELDRRFGRT